VIVCVCDIVIEDDVTKKMTSLMLCERVSECEKCEKKTEIHPLSLTIVFILFNIVCNQKAGHASLTIIIQCWDY